MQTTPPSPPAPLGRLLLRERTRLVLAWLLALGAGAVALGYAWTVYNEPARRDGNWGHANIDFAGQWLLGRMVVEGQGRSLYDRNRQRSVLQDAFPRARGNPYASVSDAEGLMGSFVGQDDPAAPATLASFLVPLASANATGALALLAGGLETWTPERLQHVTAARLGGPLYPPVQALLFAPVALFPPQPAYRLVQVLNLLLIFLGGWVVSRLSAGRVWWPVASFLLMVFPGYAGSINLGQNPALSLALLLLGWWQLSLGRPGWAGVCWGLLAFKPVWAASFFTVPLLTRRWRFAGAMLLTGAVLAAATLPVVGWAAWLDWLAVGREAARGYALYENWAVLSRDLLNLFRRWFLEFRDTFAVDPDRQLPTVLGGVLWSAVVAGTAFAAWLRRRDPAALDGPPAAFVLLGAWLSCYHFMYYDTLLAALPVCLLFTDPGRYVEAVRNGRIPFPPLLVGLLIGLTYLCALLDPTFHFPPVDTFCLLALWGWCGWTWLRTPPADTGGGRDG